MRKLIVLAGAMALAACSPSGGGVASASTAAPATYADMTKLDEKLGYGAELAYKAERMALEAAVDSGQLKGSAALTAAKYDQLAYDAKQAIHDAYLTGNAASYAAAVAHAQSAIEDALSVIGKK